MRGRRATPREQILCIFWSGGGTGFIGTALTQLLRARGHEVTLVSRKPGPGRTTWVCPSSGSRGKVWLGGAPAHRRALRFL